MISDGENGVIIVWQDDRNALDGQDIYAQRISSKGKALWGKNGKKIIQFSGNQVDVAIVADGRNGAFITWTDYRQGDRNPDIYAQRIDPQGDPLWKDDGVLLCGAPDIQRSPKIVRDEDEGIIVAWTDKGGGSYDIYAQRVDKEGRPLWITDGIPINQMSRTQQNPLFGNSKVLVWEDYRFGNWDIFAGTVDHAGKLRWGEEGVPVVDLASTQYAPQITEWKNGSVIVAWEDYRNDQFYEIYIQKVNSQGRPAWDKNGIKVQSMDGARAAKMVANPQKGSFYLFWEDFSGGGRALYGQKYLIE
jgi:hypothetical protein